MPKIDPIKIVKRICSAVQEPDLVDQCRRKIEADGITDAIDRRDSAKLFDWLVGYFPYHGISDAVASAFIERHGNVTFEAIGQALQGSTCQCPKLVRFDDFRECHYQKSARTCGQPRHLKSCPVPTHDLRSGLLNQGVYSLYLFISDVSLGDLVGFIDHCLEAGDVPGHPDRIARMRLALFSQLREIVGVSDKILNMTFATLLIGSDRRRWFEVGASMVAVDTLVHNFLHRTGVLKAIGKAHAYGPACYRPDGCAPIIDQLAREIDARQLGQIASYFPRYIQYSLWAYCAQSALNICNGNRIDDTGRCRQRACPVFDDCGRVALTPTTKLSRRTSIQNARSPPRSGST